MMIPVPELVKKHGIKVTGVLHIGGSEAQEREEYRLMGVDEVLWVEAIPSVFEKLLENIKDYPSHGAINACLSDEDGKNVEFNISNNGAQSSSFLKLGVHKEIHPEVSYVDTIQLKTDRFDTLIKHIGIDISRLNMLSCDTQGAELLVLQGMGEYLGQFDCALLELNKRETYIGCALVEDVDYFMLRNGFERVETGAWVGDSWTDGFYKKVYE